MLRNASKEYMLATMYHEVLHAYLHSLKMELGSPAFADQYPSIVEYSGITGSPKYELNHDDMGGYIDDLAQAIRSFNPNVGPYEALVLAKNGIVNPNSISSFEKNINSNFRNSIYGTPCDTTP